MAVLKACCTRIWRKWALPLFLSFLMVTYTSWEILSRGTSDQHQELVVKTPENLNVGVKQQQVSRREPVAKDPAQKVILLSYMRGGTTFVGSVFDKNPDIFYLFEPEWAMLFTVLNEYQPIKYPDGSERDPIWIDQSKRIVEETVWNSLTCNFTGIDIVSLYSRFMNESHYTRPFYKCVRRPKANIHKCIEDLTKSCKEKKIRFAKTVRLRMDIAKDMLKKDPSLRIIHMLRDPRGVAVSRIGWAEFYAVKMGFTMGRVCAEMIRDIETVENMDSELSDRILPVLYEDIAENPGPMFQSLHSFLKLSEPKEVQEYVKKITKAKSDNRVGFNTQRADSSKTAHRWRSKIRWNLCQEIDNMCKRVYRKIGVTKVDDLKTLTNYNVSFRTPDRTQTYMHRFRKNV